MSATIGWDVGGAHLKACLVVEGRIAEVAQWPCPLWQGLDKLARALDEARTRWPAPMRDAATRHGVTMTGEMVDLFPDRAAGVRALAAALAEALGPRVWLYAGGAPAGVMTAGGAPAGGMTAGGAPAGVTTAGGAPAGVTTAGDAPSWVEPHAVADAWRAIASANWRATAAWVARALPQALLVDIGSTTTDLIAVRHGAVCGASDDDAARLADGSLVYHGVVRTPLCALAPRVPFGGQRVNVMNEFFATTADVYRLTGELDALHDQQPAADNQGKDAHATRQRLARMIGRDAGDASHEAWLALAHAWRRAQVDEIAGQAARVIATHALADDAPLVSAGCGDFLVAALAPRLACRRVVSFASLLSAPIDPDVARWAQVAAPAVAVALLLTRQDDGAAKAH